MNGIIAAVLLPVLLCAQKPAVEQAWELLAQDKRPAAVALLRSAVRARPVDADARLLLGSLLAEAGESAEAIAHLREGVRLRPMDAMAQNALGEALR
ncbi:MAG TPA: tetratricopeptide repeat protein, partial [Bryobacteraceae bacterium]|nr:tetratricopeptide repeat protein [Bryobacteraceae bacterium]